MRINTNINSMTAQESASQVGRNLQNSLEKLSSGLRINKASDDASGMAIADKLRTQASSLGQSIDNANSASSLIQIADKAMAEQSNILDIVKSKLIQAKTATTSADGRKAILKDVQKLLTQLDNIASQTNYNGVTLLQSSSSDTGASAAMTFHVGESSTNTISSTAAQSNSTVLGGGGSTLAANTTGVTLSASGSKAIQATGATDAISVQTDDTAATTGDLDVTLNGKIYSLSGSSYTATLTVTNAEDIAFMDALALNTEALTGSNGTYTLGTGGDGALVLDNHNFSAIQVTQGADQAGTGDTVFDIFSANTVTVTNNDAEGMQVAAASAGLTGGDLLSTLKTLNEDSLTATVAGDYMAVVDAAITQLNTTRSDFGSTQNQLESAVRNMMTTQTNIKAAESVIRDVDYAAESANFNKQNIIAQAGTYAMSQANAIQQNVLRLLQ